MIVQCAYCGTPIERPERYIKERKWGTFCSPECNRKWRSENLRKEKSPNYGKGRFKFSKEELEKLYWSLGLSIPDIEKLTGVSRSYIFRKFRDYGIPLKHRNIADLKPSSELYYIYGVVLGDGTLENKRYGIKLGVTNKKFAESFRKALESLGLRTFSWTEERRGKSRRKTTYYYVKTYSKNLYQWLRSNPEVPQEFYKDFLRGFYESEGTRSQAKVTNTNLELLKKYGEMLKHLGFSYNIIKREQKGWGTKPVYSLYLLGGKSSQERFIELVNPCIKRG